MSGRRRGNRVLQRTWAVPAILLSGVLMLISAGLPAGAAPGGQSRGASVEAGREPVGLTVTSVDELKETSAPAVAPTSKLGYAPPTPAGTDVDPLDLYTLETGDGVVDSVPADSMWTPTDPDRGPPAARQ